MNFPEGWYKADEEEALRLHKELNTEMLQVHFLYQKNIEIVAHRDGATDDILCKHLDDENLYTVVHLTWKMKPEIDNRFPAIEFHGSFEGFCEYEANFPNSS